MEPAAGLKSRILIVGSTGNLGRLLVKESLAGGHPTFALARSSAFSDPEKAELLRSFASAGATLLEGCLEDFGSLVDAVGRVNVVISAVSSKQVLDQKALIYAIKEVEGIKRFIPAEFGSDPDKASVKGMDYNFYENKSEIRCLIEKEGIPHTYVCCNFYTSYLLPSLAQPDLKSPPQDRVKIFGDGKTKAIFVKECDVAAFTISTVDDPRSLNKVLYLRPLGNICSMNELVEIWEAKIGRTLDREYVTEGQLLKSIKETPYPKNLDLIFIYSAFVRGDHAYYDIDHSSGLDGAQIYPHVRHTTIRDYLDTLHKSLLENSK